MRNPTFLRRLAPGLLCASLVACSSPPKRAADGQDPRFQPASASDVLVQTNWELARWTLPGGALRPVPHPSASQRPITAAFIHDQGSPRLMGFAGCNTYNAPYTIANGLLIVRADPVSTRMVCAPNVMQIEHAYLAALTRITATSFDNTNNPQRMTWKLSTGDTLDFGRRVDPVAGGQLGAAKLVYVNAERVPCQTGAGRALCYQVRDSASQPWQVWHGEITGFNFQPGVRYRLRVVEIEDPNPPMGASPLRWVLDAVVEQQIVSP
ncbi:META and DUF4377 domain-containing protein [Achromobacter mucicolens]|uniref:META and DUF4377 domain-containing protein n=1 Tax=Achromobacter mucicolens TaxID=1389922 RepID=UPI0021D0FF1F|nr:META and DUF4377 domain-containing protein [Achromobacter mucicolens]MCU6615580.1 META and DUF4377 domain-containing protein [Achromobacter mucicolens]